MKSVQTKSPQQVCRDILIEEKRYNTEHHILPSECAVVDRLLTRELELKSVYDELHEALGQSPGALRFVLQSTLSIAAFWNPEQLKQARENRVKLYDINRQISKRAFELAELLNKRAALHEASRFVSDTSDGVCDLIEAASRDNYRFMSFVQQPLNNLSHQYDGKYWPSLDEFVREIALNTESAVISATDSLTAVATETKRPSRVDFLRIVLEVFKENTIPNGDILPRGFRLSDRSLAALSTCALGLDADHPIDETDVKGFRQRERKRSVGNIL